ncbi:MAG TPA: S41 family peptidase, partial [Candidatus Cloacimonadota bacterium]|nr:S41 family peptidase [Candidatus Cloacimonadota bacterium]
INEMIGDVNASHTGFYPRRDGERPYKAPAYLGLDLDYKKIVPEGLRIARVYPNTRLSSFYKLKEGDILLSIDGTRINPNTPIDSLLAGKAGKQVRLKVTSSGAEKEITLKALSSRENYDLWYAFKTNRSRELVDRLSNGRMGYVHIPAMGNENYNTFVRDVFCDNHDKEALVIDVRGNVGGRIHDMLITLLAKQTYAYSTSRRYSREKRPEPLRTIDKPTIVLVDERSFSDGEIFPIVYQEVGLGKVVGMPSSGAVIGTWEYTLVDGSSMRMPGSGWYKLDGTNMEGTGAMPDIVVENDLNDLLAGRDKQLERAVEELLKELK